MYLNDFIHKVDSVDEAVSFLVDGCEPVGEVEAVNLTQGLDIASDLRSMADAMDRSCCGIGEGLFFIEGQIWFVFCDYGH